MIPFRRNFLFTTLLILSALLSGCAVVNSTKQSAGNAEAPKNGFSYFLPKGKVLVTLTWNPSVRSWDVNPTIVYEPDTSKRFNLDWKDNYCFDDDITVSEDPATGLLQTVNASSTDQSVNTAGNFIGPARNIYPLGSSIAPISTYSGEGFSAGAYNELVRTSPKSVPTSSDWYPSTAQVVVDTDTLVHDVVLLASPIAVGTQGDSPAPRVYAAIKVRLIKKFELGADFPRNKKLVIPTDGKAAGIAVRVPIPYALEVDEVVSSDATFTDETKPRVTYSIAPRTVMLPDPAHDCLLPISKRPLVADNVRVELSNGMVQSLQQVRPSMVAAIIGVPSYLLTALVPVPIQIKQNQQNISDSESKIVESDAAAGTATEKK